MSTDGTRDILARLAAEDPRLRLVDNVQKITPCARNIGVKEARGRFVAILDAHTEYAKNYVLTCVRLLEEHPEVCCTGGPIISCGRGLFGRAAAAAMSHVMGIGNAKHRLPGYEGYAEGACFPVFRKEIFNKVGLFDEALVRNQDDEFNFRLALHGEKIFISPRAKCKYYVRESARQLLQQYLQYGYWRAVVLRKHRRLASFRHAIPILLVLSILFSALVGLLLPGTWRLLGAALPLLYILGLLAGGLAVAMRAGPAVGSLFPVAAAIMHFGYAGGFICGLLRGAELGIDGVPAAERWSRESRG
jgi:glycosyltransferase involved in cell wall biosynthesis